MSDSGKAVFLSYASQDAEAAKRLCEALRAAGVEVWFDSDGGLEQGDEWDAKIRRQIKECVLFIPVISANTQAREEGYFRLEWDMAAERARSIASGVAFILPVVIDDTKEPAALVPDRFRAVQWTRLPGGVLTPDVKARFLKLWSHRTGALKEEATRTPNRTTLPDRPAPARAGRYVLAFAALALVAGAGWWLLRRPDAPVTTQPTAVVSEARQLVAKAWEQMNKPEMSRTELSIADSLCQQAAKLDASDAEVWAAWSQVDTWLCYHNFEYTPARRESARNKAAQALKINPSSFEGRLAQACYLVRNGGDRALPLRSGEAEILLQALLVERPDEPRSLLALGILQRNLDRFGEARLTLGRLTRNPAFAALGWAEIGFANLQAGDWAAAEKAADQSLALQSFWINQAVKIILLLEWRGDLASAKKMVDQMTAMEIQEDYAIHLVMQLYLWRREPQQALELAAGIPRDWLLSNGFNGPLGWWTGQAEQMAGRAEAAKVRWRAALKLVEQRLSESPSSAPLILWRGMLLAALGERAESEGALKLAREMGARDLWNYYRVQCEILNGHPDAALDLLEKTARANPANLPVATLRLEPIYDPLREQPRFKALLATQERDPRASPPAGPSTLIQVVGAPDSKSVAVLAFANLSDDKANEYFSDGISEELLNVLAKVPGLKVSARTSAFYFKGKEVPIPEIAQKLGVAYVVEGSVRKAGDKVRVTAQLIKAADGFHVWSDTFTRDLKDIFAVQDEIAGLIAKALELKISRASAETTVNPEAYQLLLQARHFAQQQKNEASMQALDYYHRVLTLEPGSALAWAELAKVYIQLARFNGMPTAEGMRQARAAARRALELDPDQPIGLDALAWVQRTADWDWRGAQKSFQRALELAPANPLIMSDAAVLYFNIGRIDEACALVQGAAKLDPLNGPVQIVAGDILTVAGRPEEGVPHLLKGIALTPEVEEFRSHLAYGLAHLGRFAEAKAMAALEPNPDYRLYGQGMVASLQGDRPAYLAARAELVARAGVDMSTYIATLYACGHDNDQAFAWLDRAYARRESGMAWTKTDPYLKNLHADPRWALLLNKLGLADDQLK